MLVTTSLLVTLLGLFTAGPGDCNTEESVGRLVTIDVRSQEAMQIRRAGDSKWTTAQEGLLLCAGDQVRTRFETRGQILLALADGDSISAVAGPNTRLRLGQPGGNHRNVAIEVVHGVIRFSFSNASTQSSAVIRTGSTTCVANQAMFWSNWDPFKAEANYVVVKGAMVCDSGLESISAGPGVFLEFVRGDRLPPRSAPELIRDVFDRATRLQ